MPAALKLTGKKFNGITVIKKSEKRQPCGKPLWECVCKCGNKIFCTGPNLKGGYAKSCGRGACHPKYRHGASRSRKYLLWRAMINRCYQQNDKRYKNYGGRGIRVCKRWHNYNNFYADMGERPSGMSLGRIDNNKGYSKENCRWETWEEQHNNRRNNRVLTLNGRKQTVYQWSRELKMRPSTIFARIKNGWADKEILTTPVQEKYRPRRYTKCTQ